MQKELEPTGRPASRDTRVWMLLSRAPGRRFMPADAPWLSVIKGELGFPMFLKSAVFLFLQKKLKSLLLKSSEL